MPTGKWGAQQWVRLTEETTYGVYPTSPTDASPLYTSIVQWIRLQDGNAFTMDPQPLTQEVRTADARNKVAYRTAQRQALRAKLRVNCPADQICMLIGWATNLSGTDGDVLKSITIDWMDGYEKRRGLGMVIESLSLSCDNEKDFLVADIEFVGKKIDSSAPTLVEPALTKFPVGRPYCIQDCAGLVTAPTTVTGYKSLSVSIKNRLFAPFNEDQYIQGCVYRGREVNWSIALLQSAAVLRAAHEAQTKIATCQVQFSQTSPAVHSLLLDFKSSNYITKRAVDRTFDGSIYENLDVVASNDATAGTDLAITAT